jgi:exodeoxyribonuclease V beta subunit
MQIFNVLSAGCPIFGPHLLEASAGTGKTFSIEHVVVRLLLQSEEIGIEQVLAVTFTRAATRDLKRRIRANLEEALFRIQSGMGGWEYLDPYLGSQKAARKLSDAILAFDQCQIFTIHGFCHRCLQEFAFETGGGFSLQDPDRAALVPKRILREAKKFLETGIGPDLLCREQMASLLKHYDSLEEVMKDLLKKKSESAAPPFATLLKRYQALLREPADESALLEAFREIQPGFKVEVKGDFESQIKALVLAQEKPADTLRHLIKERGSLFTFLSPTNRKVKATIEVPEFFNWACRAIGPIIEVAIDPKKILGCLQAAWKKIEEPLLRELSWFDPDEILKQMRSAVERQPIAAAIRKKYKAVIVDEFQDTDPLQWEIFKILFLKDQEPLHALYLVGDPKQSIYRFRKADIYTYFEARGLLGPSSLFCLDTNYRSSSKMVRALNALFDRNWLSLPKLGASIPCPAVKSSSKVGDLPDALGAVHFIAGSSFEEGWLPYAVSEIERLQPVVESPASFAILVKDRHQAETALRLLQKRSIPAIAKSHSPLGKTLAFQSVREVFEALDSPRDRDLSRAVAAGPFRQLAISDARSLLESQGFIPLCRQMIASSVGAPEFGQDLSQVIEELLACVGKFGFSFEGLFRFLDDFERLGPDEGGRRRVETESEAVQILTLHVSKGLEFDIVFALGLSTRQPESEEPDEAGAEQLRQVYVAMTRAKRRLYVPISTSEKGRGLSSPMELFCQILETQEGPIVPFFKKSESMTYENLPERVALPEETQWKISAARKDSPQTRAPLVSPCFLHSFTSLAQPGIKKFIPEDAPSQMFTPHTIPRGVGTGILIHQIFESLFSSSTPLWKDLQAVESLISEQLSGTSLLPWEPAIKEMVWKILHLSLPLNLESSFTLIELEPGQLQAEMEFLFSQPPHYIKGYIDLVFQHDGKFYFIDWKTNWLGPDDGAYLSLNEAMTEHDYWLQAKLYGSALERHVKRFYTQPFEEIFGGAIYLFLRGGGLCLFKPELDGI